MSTTEVQILARPYRVAAETFVIPQVEVAPPVGRFCLNSLVIRGAEPVIVDTGTAKFRQNWLQAAWEIVDPEDVRWIYVSHDDPDHAGNLRQALEACPNATLVTTWFQVGRMSTDHTDGWMPPMERLCFANDDESFDAGDRRLTAVRPPFFDNPTTRGLFDHSTGVYWSVDSFGTVFQEHVEDAADLPADEWRDGVLLVNRLNHPWHQWLDERKFKAHVDHVASYGIQTIASCHSPAIYGAQVAEAFDLIRRVPSMEAYEDFTQADLDQWLAMATEPV